MAAVHPIDEATARSWLAVAVEEARAGLAEGGIPIGAALVGADGQVLGRGHNRRVQDGDPSVHGETDAFRAAGRALARGPNRRVQDGDPSVHGETDAFRAAGRQRSYRGTTMVTTLSPCWYCSGLVRQFGISRVVIGEARTFSGGHDWLAEHGVEVLVLDDPECIDLMTRFVREHTALWFEDIGEEDTGPEIGRAHE